MAPLPLTELFGQFGFFGIVFLIGIGFGAVLEASGFGDSRKLAAQFYLRDQTVLKVMFSGIIVAMTLVFLSAALGLLDYDYLYVNTTYLLPGIVGGLIMGVGFVIGGFCPGTSLVGMASLKLDALLFVVGVLFGIFVFGETIDSTFSAFWHSTNMGRFTLQDLLGVDAGVVVLAIIVIAIAMFFGAEKIEQMMSGKKQPSPKRKKFEIAAASGLVVVGFLVMAMGQPTVSEKWQRLPEETRKKLDDKSIFVSPVEMLHVMKGRNTEPVIFDLRAEQKYNQFHIVDSKRYQEKDFEDLNLIRELKTAPNRVYFLVADDDQVASEYWKNLVSQKVPNVYILDGGIKEWIHYFSGHDSNHSNEPIDLSHLTNPDIHHYQDVKFTPRVKLAKVKAAAGGCG